jgi:hypothetical protein
VNPRIENEVDPDGVPPANTGLRVVAGLLLVVPIVALLWVGHYAKEEPTLAGWPFFIWYQFLWILICSAMTYLAYRLVRIARPHRPLVETGRRQR